VRRFHTGNRCADWMGKWNVELVCRLLGPIAVPIREPSTNSLKAIKSNQVNLLITYNSFWIVQRAIAQWKTGNFHGNGVAEAPPVFQAGWSECRIGAQPRCLVGRISCRKDWSILCCARHFKTANSTPLISISRNLAPFDELASEVITQKCLFVARTHFICGHPRGQGLLTL
jgi:hypothetical protein